MILRGMIVYDYHYALTLEFCENGSPGAISHQGEAWDVRYHEKSYLEQYCIKVKPEMWDTMRNLTWNNITSRWSLRCEIPWEILLGAISHQGEARDVRYHEKSYLGALSHQGEAWDVRYHEKSYLQHYQG
jgi:hypothetical protein